jgi:hypothetical protein
MNGLLCKQDEEQANEKYVHLPASSAIESNEIAPRKLQQLQQQEEQLQHQHQQQIEDESTESASDYVRVPPETTSIAEATDSDSNSSTNTNTIDYKNNDPLLALDASAICYNPRQGNFLPDIDDNAMLQVSQYITLYHKDLAWSFTSDTVFFIGGILYIVLSALDVTNGLITMQDQLAIVVLQLTAPLVYVLNSLVDIQWSLHVQTRGKEKRVLLQDWDGWRHIDTAAAAAEETTDENSRTTLLDRLRKHAAHRRSVMTALTFGIAAVLGFSAAVARKRQMAADWLDAFENYFYVLSAVLCISGKRTRPWMAAMPKTSWTCNPHLLEDLGDLLFFAGTVIDTLLTELSLEKPLAELFTSVLWLADACLYLRSDFVMAHDGIITDDQSLLV